VERLIAHLGAAAAVCKRDVILFATYRLRLITTFTTTAVSLTLFYYISRLVSSGRIGSPDRYYAFVVIGMVILAVLTSTLATPAATLRQELLTGTFERMVLSPFGPVRCVLSLMIFPLLLALLTSIFTIAFAAVVFGLTLHSSTAAAGIPVALLGALAFAPFGLFMTAGLVVLKQTRAGAMFVVTVLTVVSGVYFPVVLLPHWVRWLSDVQPFTPAVDLLRNLLVGTPLRESAALSLVKLIAFPGVLLPLAIWTLNAAVGLARRRGTIIEY
jgi:ABC-2 type transport system permease protein